MLSNFLNKNNIINDFKINIKNIGSHKTQVVLLTFRIIKLQKHISIYKKDFHSKRGLLKLVFQRRRILKYLKLNNINKYYFLLKKLKLRDL